jgi:hypothetical protein
MELLNTIFSIEENENFKYNNFQLAAADTNDEISSVGIFTSTQHLITSLETNKFPQTIKAEVIDFEPDEEKLSWEISKDANINSIDTVFILDSKKHKIIGFGEVKQITENPKIVLKDLLDTIDDISYKDIYILVVKQ